MKNPIAIFLDFLLIIFLAIFFFLSTNPVEKKSSLPVIIQPIDLQQGGELPKELIIIRFYTEPVILDRSLFPYEYNWPEVPTLPQPNRVEELDSVSISCLPNNHHIICLE